MSHPKGKVPNHIKAKAFCHPGRASHIVLTLCEVEDPLSKTYSKLIIPIHLSKFWRAVLMQRKVIAKKM